MKIRKEKLDTMISCKYAAMKPDKLQRLEDNTSFEKKQRKLQLFKNGMTGLKETAK